MATFSQMTVKGVTYDVKDKWARTNFDNYVEKETGKGLSTNDFTDELKAKLTGLDSVMELKGTVSSVSELPTDAVVGDLYLVGVADSGDPFKEYVFTSQGWDQLGEVTQIDLTNYTTKNMHKQVTDWIDGVTVTTNTDGDDTYTLNILATPTWEDE